MTAPSWLPTEFRAEFDRLVRDVMERPPTAIEAELVAICAVLMERWRALAGSPPTDHKGGAWVLATDLMLQSAKHFSRAALVSMRWRNH